ncbi:DUF6117 family protein [Telmatospirillum sp. J64-1]|nr:DUF6117 family protein [Telmatospirillum sp. J64-1]
MIPDHIRANFQTLMRAAENGDLAEKNPYEAYRPPE